MFKALKILFLLVLVSPLYSTMMLKSCRYDAKFELEGYPKVGNEFTLTLKVKAVYASPMTQMQMFLPKNVTMLGSDTTWQGSLEPGDSVLLPVHLKIDEIGAYCFSALIKDAVEDTHYFPYNVATCLIVSNEDTAFIGDTLMPYNLDLEISPKELKKQFPPSKDLLQIRTYGQVKCLNKSGQEEVMPGVWGTAFFFVSFRAGGVGMADIWIFQE
jgi:hypothetical protein